MERVHGVDDPAGTTSRAIRGAAFLAFLAVLAVLAVLAPARVRRSVVGHHARRGRVARVLGARLSGVAAPLFVGTPSALMVVDSATLELAQVVPLGGGYGGSAVEFRALGGAAAGSRSGAPGGSTTCVAAARSETRRWLCAWARRRARGAKAAKAAAEAAAAAAAAAAIDGDHHRRARGRGGARRRRCTYEHDDDDEATKSSAEESSTRWTTSTTRPRSRSLRAPSRGLAAPRDARRSRGGSGEAIEAGTEAEGRFEMRGSTRHVQHADTLLGLRAEPPADALPSHDERRQSAPRRGKTTTTAQWFERWRRVGGERIDSLSRAIGASASFQAKHATDGAPHDAAILRCEYSPDGSGSSPPPPTRPRVTRLPSRDIAGTGYVCGAGSVSDACWSSNGATALTCSARDRTARMWTAGRPDARLVFDHRERGSPSNRPGVTRTRFREDVTACRFLHMDRFVLLACGSELLLYRYALPDDDERDDLRRLAARGDYRLAFASRTSARSVLDARCVNDFVSRVAVVAWRSIRGLLDPVGRWVRRWEDAHDNPRTPRLAHSKSARTLARRTNSSPPPPRTPTGGA